MNKGNTQMSKGELEALEVLLKEGYSIPKAATALGRNKTTIYRLFQENSIEYNQTKWKYIGGMIGKTGKRVEDNLVKVGKKKIHFKAKTVHNKRVQRKSNAGMRYCRIELGGKLEGYILEKIKEYYSPKQISGRWRTLYGDPLSKDTIYSYVYNTHPELIKKFFRRKGKKYQNKRKQKYQIDDRRMIDRRPKVIEKRTNIGHWEADTVVGKKKALNKKVIVTNVERKSGYLIADIVDNSTAKCVSESIIRDFNNIPKYKRKTITFDNGREFAYHYDIERLTKMTTYFAHPYSPWQRGTNENTNGLLRQFLPKGTDFSNLTKKELQRYVTLINNRPRERLGFMTPYEVFNNFKKSCIGL